MKPLYLLAFLLTANHKQAEQCFASTVEEALKEQAVFKEWARSWVKRTLIEKAIQIVSPVLDRPGEKRDLWSVGQNETLGQDQIDAVAKLAPLERFVFVMSILERHSQFGLRSVAWMQHEQSSGSGEERIAPTSRIRQCAPVPREGFDAASSGR